MRLPHVCSQHEAADCLREWLPQLREKYQHWIRDASLQWEGNAAQLAIGLRVGTISLLIKVEPDCVDIEPRRVPLLARPFWRNDESGGRAGSAIRETLAVKCAECTKSRT